MTEERYNLLLELLEEVQNDIYDVSKELNISSYVGPSSYDSDGIELRGEEPWQYGDSLYDNVPIKFILDHTREQALQDLRQQRADAEKRRLEQEEVLKQAKDAKEFARFLELKKKFGE